MTPAARALAVVAIVAPVAFAGCLPPLSPRVANTTDVRYRQRTAPADTTIAIYRWFGARSSSVSSRCKMIPSDSVMFAVRADRCGGLRAWYWGVARVLLEEAGSSKFATPLRMGGRLRWVDLPALQCGG